MAESIIITGSNRKEKYTSLVPQLRALFAGEKELIANMSNTCAALKDTFGFLWVGFYIVTGNELVVGPYQGPMACTRIQKGKGVCGTAWEKKQVLIVKDVNAFPGHISCSALSKSEIVVPLIKNNEVFALLDIDSEKLNDFDSTDKWYLEMIASILSA